MGHLKSDAPMTLRPNEIEIAQLLEAVKNQVGEKAYWLLKRIVYQHDLVRIERQSYLEQIATDALRIKELEALVRSLEVPASSQKAPA